MGQTLLCLGFNSPVWVVFLEFFFFWLLLLLFGELCSLPANAPYAYALVFSAILILALWLFAGDFDLFAAILLALYSSVFLLLSLFILYFNRYWGKGATAGTGSIADFVALIAIVVLPFDFFLLDGVLLVNSHATVTAHSWSYYIISYDFYATLLEGTTRMAVLLMHAIFYKFFAIEVFFLNLYLFFGLIFAVGLTYILKLWLNPSIVGQLFSAMRVSFSFFFPSNFRVHAANRFRRQSRRKNSSQVKFRNHVFLCFKN